MGAVPGLGGVLGMILLLPFTFDMEPVHAFALLLGLFAVTSTSDTIASVMLGIPGTAASQATILDGYPLAKKGQAARAFGAAAGTRSQIEVEVHGFKRQVRGQRESVQD